MNVVMTADGGLIETQATAEKGSFSSWAQLNGRCRDLAEARGLKEIFAAQRILEMEGEIGEGGKSPLEVRAEIRFPGHTAIGDPQEPGGHGRGQLHVFLVVAHNLVQIMSIPGRNPVVGQTPGFVSRHVAPLLRDPASRSSTALGISGTDYRRCPCLLRTTEVSHPG
jgi:hypothetical protein